MVCFRVILIPHEISIHSFSGSFHISLFSYKTIQQTPTHKLVRVADGRKCNRENVHNFHVSGKKVSAAIHLHVVIQHAIVKLTIVRTHNHAGVVAVRDSGKVSGDFSKWLYRDIMKHKGIMIELMLTAHEAVACDKREAKRCIRDFRDERIVTLKNVTVRVADNPCHVKRKTRVSDGFNVKNSKDLTHDRTPLVPEGGAVPRRQLNNTPTLAQSQYMNSIHIFSTIPWIPAKFTLVNFPQVPPALPPL